MEHRWYDLCFTVKLMILNQEEFNLDEGNELNTYSDCMSVNRRLVLPDSSPEPTVLTALYRLFFADVQLSVNGMIEIPTIHCTEQQIENFVDSAMCLHNMSVWDIRHTGTSSELRWHKYRTTPALARDIPPMTRRSYNLDGTICTLRSY